jgi:hypothetical protein
MLGHTWVDCRYTLAALFERPVVIKPPEVVATHDLLGIGAISLAVGALLYVGYAAPAVVAMLTTGSTIIDNWTAFFAFTFATQPLSPILIGAGAVAVFLILIGVVYLTTVRRTSTGNYEGARAASLFYGVIMILVSLASFGAFFGYAYAASAAILILPALFFLMGYGKMGEVIARYGPMAVLSDASPIETASQIPSGAGVPAMPMMAAPAMGMGAVAIPANSGGAFSMPAPPLSPPYQHLGGAVPRVPLCPTCGRELFYASNYKRWYCLVCESRR